MFEGLIRSRMIVDIRILMLYSALFKSNLDVQFPHGVFGERITV